MYRQLEASHDNVLGFQFSGMVTEKDAREILGRIASVIDRERSVCLLVKLPEEPAHAQLAALNEKLRFFRDHANSIERYALVTNKTLLKWASRAADVLTPMEVRPYELAQENDAWHWLETGDDGS